jgi:hypothetical protein
MNTNECVRDLVTQPAEMPLRASVWGDELSLKQNTEIRILNADLKASGRVFLSHQE